MQMFKGKENQQDLIYELRTVSGLQSEEQQLQKADKKLIITLKKQRNQQRHKVKHSHTTTQTKCFSFFKLSHDLVSISSQEAQAEASYATVEGAELERMFDTLSKELIHLQEERRIHAFLLVADRERRRREAEESGRRQVEEHRRREEDDVFRQVCAFLFLCVQVDKRIA